MASLNLPLHSYEHRSRPASSARLVNGHAELSPAGAKTPVLVTRSPGIRPWAVVGSGPIRAIYVDVDYTSPSTAMMYVVSGTELYSVTADKTITLLGDVGVYSGNIDIDSNDTGLVVVNEPDAYTWDGTTFSKILDDDFTSRGAGDVEFMDNYLLFREPDTDRFFGADLGSRTSFDSLQFANADSAPDHLTGMISDHRQLVLFGNEVGEIFENTGVSGFPFERVINGTIEKGCFNGRTIARQDTAIFWLADDLTVRTLDGLNPVRVSTHGVEQSIESKVLSSASAFTYEHLGHFFYVLNFDDGTWVYDITTGEWAERESYLRPRWSVQSSGVFSNLVMVGNFRTNEIGYLDYDYQWEWGPRAKNLIYGGTTGQDTSYAKTTAVITENYAVGSSGRTNAARLIDDNSSGTGSAIAYQNLLKVLKANTNYILQARVKQDLLTWAWLRMAGVSDVIAADGYFDLANGVKGTMGADVDDSGIVAVGNSFYDIWFKFGTETDLTTYIPRLYPADADEDATVDMDGTSSILFESMQLYEGEEYTPLIETDEGEVWRQGIQRMEWTYQPVYAEQQRAFHDRLEVVLETGVGRANFQGSDPKLMCSYSDDGGITWRALPDQSIGARGKTETRVKWENLGSARQRVYRMAVSDPVPITITDTLLEVRGGRL